MPATLQLAVYNTKNLHNFLTTSFMFLKIERCSQTSALLNGNATLTQYVHLTKVRMDFADGNIFKKESRP